MAVLYVIAAWFAMQATEVLMELADLPKWIGTSTLWILAIGFPIALIFSWFFELTPDGISLEKDVDPVASITNVTGRRLDFIVISLLCAAVILFAYDKWIASGPPENSIAVLPFVNMSDDSSNEYFSDGISEELLNMLAKIPELKVISRTSAFSYKGTDAKLTDVARELNVAHILEGSVRRSGEQVRITTQLIEARSDTHLWSETYDRSVDDIFLVQDEIAAVVVEKLKITLLGEVPVVQPTSADAYTLYLQARYLAKVITEESLTDAISLFKDSLKNDPGYYPAWVGLGGVYSRMLTMQLMPANEAQSLALDSLHRALQIAPDSAQVMDHLGWYYFKLEGNLSKASEYIERALRLDPTNTNFIGNASIFLAALGRMDEGIQLAEYQVSRDPVNALAFNNLGIRYRYDGQSVRARGAFTTALKLNPEFMGVGYELGATYLLEGNDVAALSAFEKERHAAFKKIGQAMTYHAQGEVEMSDRLVDELVGEYGEAIAFYLAAIFAFRHDNDDAFSWLEKAKLAGDPEISNVHNEPLLNNLHIDPRWLPFLDSVGQSKEDLAAITLIFDLPGQ